MYQFCVWCWRTSCIRKSLSTLSESQLFVFSCSQDSSLGDIVRNWLLYIIEKHYQGDQSDEETWPDQQKDNDNDSENDKDI